MTVIRSITPLLLFVLISVFDQGSTKSVVVQDDVRGKLHNVQIHQRGLGGYIGWNSGNRSPSLSGFLGAHASPVSPNLERVVQGDVREQLRQGRIHQQGFSGYSGRIPEPVQQSANEDNENVQQSANEDNENVQQSANEDNENVQQSANEDNEPVQQSANEDNEPVQQSANEDNENVQQSANEDNEPVQQDANEENDAAQQYAGDSTDDLLYPYGPAQGDKMTPVEDDGTSGEVPLSITFKFFGKEYKALYVNNNGVISFSSAVSQYTPDAFPLTHGETFVTPFWGDVDNDLGGSVYYRETIDPAILQKITRDMAKHLPLKHYVATWAFIATWDKVAYYGSASTKVNTFQAVLTTDGYHYFTILNYGDIQWTTGTASDGNPMTGLGGTPAQAGFNSGDDSHYFNIPGSRTDEVLKIKSTSNVDYPGRWVFEVDNFKVLGGCSFQAKFVREGEEFWKESTCDTKCACHDSRVCCETEPCPANSTCQASGSFFTCKIKQKVCSRDED